MGFLSNLFILKFFYKMRLLLIIKLWNIFFIFHFNGNLICGFTSKLNGKKHYLNENIVIKNG